VRPTDRSSLVAGLCDAMVRLAQSPAQRSSLGRHGRDKAARDYDWNVKVDRVTAWYRTLRDEAGKQSDERHASPC
jgi:hypothetical protein